MSWPVGWSWTEGHTEIGTNPDGSIYRARVQGGPFYYNPSLFGAVYSKFGYRLEVYAGMRPTSVWSLGFGNEGILPIVKKLLFKVNMSNLGFALRLKSISNDHV